MIAQCPDCQRKLRIKPRAGTKPGQKARVTCPCGTTLRFEMPRPPQTYTNDVMNQVIQDFFRGTKA